MSRTAGQLLRAMQGFLRGRPEPLIGEFLEGMDWSIPERELEPATLPCLAHLARAAELAKGPCAELAAMLAAERDRLRWAQTYSAADFGESFLRNYGWTELFGSRGHFTSNSHAGGFLLLGPETTYPDHHHIAEEIYIPLTGGAEWRMGDGDFAVRGEGEIVHHRSEVSHAMRTGVEPLLALYLWRGGPLDQRSTIGRRD